jgi:mannose-6-phosphate isomerase-like protein (cupin superfamily)
MREAEIESTEAGQRPAGDGWFVVNVADAAGEIRTSGGAIIAGFENEEHPFPHFAINVTVLEDGVPNCLYHREGLQESFLVLDGEPLVLIEGEERRLRKWDFVHCPPGATHVFVGPGAILMVGARGPDDELHYPVDALAEKHGASAVAPTGDPQEAYISAGWSRDWRPVQMPWPS